VSVIEMTDKYLYLFNIYEKIWLTTKKGLDCITSTVVEIMKRRGYQLNSFTIFHGKMYAFFHPKEGIKWE